jgi:hypothetical protein
MAARKRMRDGAGKIVQLGDIIWWREFESLDHFSSTAQILEFVVVDGDIIYAYIQCGDKSTRHKLPHNIRKMSNSEAMLWKLENL